MSSMTIPCQLLLKGCIVFFDASCGLLQVDQPLERSLLQVYLEWGAYDVHNPQEAWDARESARRHGLRW